MVQEWFEFKVLTWPPYSPDINPAERMWDVQGLQALPTAHLNNVVFQAKVALLVLAFASLVGHHKSFENVTYKMLNLLFGAMKIISDSIADNIFFSP